MHHSGWSIDWVVPTPILRVNPKMEFKHMVQPRRVKIATVWLLVAAFVFSLLSVSFAGSPQNSQRRGKNSTTNSSTRQTANPQSDKTPATSPDNNQSTDNGRQQNKTGEVQGSSDNSPNSSDDPQSNQPKNKREPLPFDRPPLGADGATSPSTKQSPSFDRSESSGTSSRTSSGNSRTSRSPDTNYPERPNVRVQPQNEPQSRPSNYPSQRYPANHPDSDQNDSYSNGHSNPPVLRRSEDSRSANSDGNANPNATRGAPPVLHRPTDTQEPSRDSSSRPNWNQPSAPNNPTRGTPQDGTNPQQRAGSEDEPIKLDSTLVNIPLLVSDRSNRYIPQLTKKDFLLYEDGIQQEIAFFGNEEVPFSVVLMLDVSPSVSGSVRDIQDAAIDFVRQLRPQDRVMVVAFDRHIDYLTDFTSDRYELERAIRSTSTGSGTSVYDAVYEVVARRLRNVDGRKALILFSDGEDTTSRRASADDVIATITESDVLVYGLRYPGSDGGNIRVNPWPRSIPQLPIPLPFPWPFPRRRGPFGHLVPDPNAPAGGQWPRRGNNGDFMSEVANAGGGTVFDAQQVGDMRGLATRIAEELRHVYVLSYYPSNALANGGFRTIRIRVKGRDDIAVRHRKGYNARDVARGNKI